MRAGEEYADQFCRLKARESGHDRIAGETVSQKCRPCKAGQNKRFMGFVTLRVTQKMAAVVLKPLIKNF